MLPMGEKKSRLKTFKKFREILLGLYDSIAFFSIAAAIAALLRRREGAPIFELSFLQSLLDMLFLSFLSITLVVNGVVNASPLFLSYVAKGWHRNNKADQKRPTLSSQGDESSLGELTCHFVVIYC
jgi:hypothetical protein